MYKIFEKLLERNGIKAADVCRGTGLPSSLFSEWKKGKSTPKADKLQKLADYFDVSIEYLMTGEEKENREILHLNQNIFDIAQEIFSNKELYLLFDEARKAPSEDLQTLNTVLLALRRKERGNVD